jgi:hypothetical protein
MSVGCIAGCVRALWVWLRMDGSKILLGGEGFFVQIGSDIHIHVFLWAGAVGSRFVLLLFARDAFIFCIYLHQRIESRNSIMLRF